MNDDKQFQRTLLRGFRSNEQESVEKLRSSLVIVCFVAACGWITVIGLVWAMMK